MGINYVENRGGHRRICWVGLASFLLLCTWGKKTGQVQFDGHETSRVRFPTVPVSPRFPTNVM